MMNDLLPFVYAGLALVIAVTIWMVRRHRVVGTSPVIAPPAPDPAPGFTHIILPGTSLRMEFAPIPSLADAGHLGRPFRIGSQEKDEWPPQDAVVAESFYAATTVVTQAQFAAWTITPHYEEWRMTSGLDEAHRNHFHGAGPDHPAERVTYGEAEAYCGWLNQPGIFPPGISAQLPSEIEWEFMARAGTDTEYWPGDGPAALEKAGWYSGNSGAKTHPVGELAANPWGLYDVHGLVYEWTRTVWSDHGYRVDEPASSPDSPRVYRGGSWGNSARYARSAYRGRYHPRGRLWYGGFRVCAVPGPLSSRSEQQRPREDGGNP